jgi:hypothetical protein
MSQLDRIENRLEEIAHFIGLGPQRPSPELPLGDGLPLSVPEAAELWGMSRQRVGLLCRQARVLCEKRGFEWVILQRDPPMLHAKYRRKE